MKTPKPKWVNPPIGIPGIRPNFARYQVWEQHGTNAASATSCRLGDTLDNIYRDYKERQEILKLMGIPCLLFIRRCADGQIWAPDGMNWPTLFLLTVNDDGNNDVVFATYHKSKFELRYRVEIKKNCRVIKDGEPADDPNDVIELEGVKYDKRDSYHETIVQRHEISPE